MRTLRALLLISLLLSFPATLRAQAESDTTAPTLVGTLGARIGVYSADKLEETNITGDEVRQRRASDIYFTINGTRQLWPNLALEISFGALSRGDAFIRNGTTLTRARLTIFPLSAGLRLYPVAPASGARILPYLSAAGSLILGVQVIELSTFQSSYNSETKATIGAVAGAGVDYRVGERLLLGAFGGYQRARFSKPLSDLPGGVSDFSGPQFMISFSYLISGTDGGPRGEGRNGS